MPGRCVETTCCTACACPAKHLIPQENFKVPKGNLFVLIVLRVCHKHLYQPALGNVMLSLLQVATPQWRAALFAQIVPLVCILRGMANAHNCYGLLELMFAAGQYSATEQSSVCADCAPGFLALNPGMTACTQCQPGFFIGASGDCQTCAPGRYSSVVGANACLRW